MTVDTATVASRRRERTSIIFIRTQLQYVYGKYSDRSDTTSDARYFSI